MNNQSIFLNILKSPKRANKIVVIVLIIIPLISFVFPSQAQSNQETLLYLETDNDLAVRLYKKDKQEQIYVNIFDKKNVSLIANKALAKAIQANSNKANENQSQENFWLEIWKLILPPFANSFSFLFIGLVIWFFRFKIVEFISKLNIKSLSVGDFKIELIEKNLLKAYRTKNLSLSENEQKEIENLLKYSAPFVQGKTILWVDDNPDNNKNEREVFSQLNINIDISRTSDEAKNNLSNTEKFYDLMISDWNRSQAKVPGTPEGLRFLQEIRAENINIPVIFYHGLPDNQQEINNRRNLSNQAGALGNTWEPSELIKLTIKELVRSSLSLFSIRI